MNRTPFASKYFARLKRPVLISVIAALLVAIVSPFGVAVAEAPQFVLSRNSGRPGLTINVKPGDPCPALAAGFDVQSVEFTFVDSNNTRTVSHYTASVDPEGNWIDGTILTIPWRDVVGHVDPIETKTAAATGMASIEARCVFVKANDLMNPDDNEYQTSQNFAPQNFLVDGPSAEFNMPTTSMETGATLRIESIDECNGTEVSGSVINGQAVARFSLQIPAGGSWFVDLPLKNEPPMIGEQTNLPAGKYEVNVYCMTPTGQHTMLYGERILTVTSNPTPTIDEYVAMGDSYSSGEGNAPFETGTFEPGSAMCHRSSLAYPRLLADDPDFNLDLGSNGFTACSGATTSSITTGYNSEGAQLDKVTANTDLITMTMGGNNMKFSEFAEQCVRKNCSGKPKDQAIKNIVDHVIPQMEYMLGTVRDRLINLRNSDAKVLVIGYPQIVTDKPWGNGDATGCEWLNGEREAKAIRQVVQQLNTAIKNEVEAIGHNFHFISATEPDSPFAGHELCRDSFAHGKPYFVNAILFPVEQRRFSFHPNKQGHEAYAELVKRYLRNNPL